MSDYESSHDRVNPQRRHPIGGSTLGMHDSGIVVHYVKAGTDIAVAAREACDFAQKQNRPVAMSFNDIGLIANVDDEPQTIVETYHRILDRRVKAYRESDAGKAKEAELAELRRKQELAAFEPLPSISLSKPDVWERYKANNQDDFGAATLRYAQRWGGMMEQRLAAEPGITVAQIADETSQAADTEGISGSMYKAALHVLTRCWIGGELLRQWHDSLMTYRDPND